MANRIEVESLREVAIHLTQIVNKLEDMDRELAQERAEQKAFRTQRNFVLITAFIAPLVLTFVYNAAKIGQ